VANLVDLALQRVQLFEEEQHSRREAEALNNELQTLLYSVSHDLRSPIISVLGYLNCLEQEHRAELSDPGQHYLDRITVNASYMQRLIQDLLELSRIGRVDDAVEPVDLRVVAESVAEGTRFAHPSVSVDVADDLPVVAMSDVRARQLVTNLVDNAVKHAGRPDVQVRLSATPEPCGGVTVCVADNGRGVAESYLAKAFDVFERLDAVRNGTPGTGMGLPICKRVVEGIGGTIVVDGPQPGFATGTTLRISLPASAVRRIVHALKENA
jgi:signal transduction histidine kinase